MVFGGAAATRFVRLGAVPAVLMAHHSACICIASDFGNIASAIIQLVLSAESFMKFLVLWHFDVRRLTLDVVRAIAEQPKYGEKLEADGKLECRYHVVGSHGGAWIYNVASNEELDRLLATSPVYNFATYQVLPLADMSDPYTVAGKSKQ